MSPTVPRLKRRAEFLKVARSGRRWAQPGLVVQALDRREENTGGAQQALRAGFTVTKKVGNAVVRNRVRRRLKAAAEQVLIQNGQPGHDYVIIGRQGTIRRDFTDLKSDLKSALAKLADGRGKPARRTQGPRQGAAR